MIKIPRALIVQKLIKEGKQPKTARKYTTNIIHNVLNGRSTDENVTLAHDELLNIFQNL